MPMSKKKRDLEFFKGLEDGDTFRLQSMTGKADGVYEFSNWVYCVFTGTEDGKPHWHYYDSIHPRPWKPEYPALVGNLEACDMTITQEELDSPLYLSEGANREVTKTPWTLGELEGSEWVNKWVWRVEQVIRVDYDRFRRLRLFTDSADTIGLWRAFQYRIANWLPYDTMSQEEKITCAEKRIARAVAEQLQCEEHKWSKGWYDKEVQQAREHYTAISGRTVIDQAILNMNPVDEQQLALF